MSNHNAVPLILDVDTGIDDALALLFAAASAEAELVGVTTVALDAAQHHRGAGEGFAIAASKMVVEGGVGRMVDLARSNLRNIPQP